MRLYIPKVPKALRRHVLPISAVFVGLIIGTLYLIVDSSIENIAHTVKPAAMQLVSTTPVPARELFSGQIVEGKKGLVLRLSIQNQTAHEQALMPINQAFLKSSDGKIFQMKPLGNVREPIHGGMIAAGETAEGEISFMVDEDATGLWLYLDTRWDSNNPFVAPLQL